MPESQELKKLLNRILEALLPLLAVPVAFLIGAVMILALGANPLEAYGSLIAGAFGDVSGITQTLVKATPLLLVGLGVCIAFRGGVINIGGEGQILVGALATTAVAIGLRDLARLDLAAACACWQARSAGPSGAAFRACSRRAWASMKS